MSKQRTPGAFSSRESEIETCEQIMMELERVLRDGWQCELSYNVLNGFRVKLGRGDQPIVARKTTLDDAIASALEKLAVENMEGG